MRKKTFKRQTFSLFPADISMMVEVVNKKKKEDASYNNSEAVREGLGLLYKKEVKK